MVRVLVLAAAVAVGATTAAAGTVEPKLGVRDLTPLVVRGAHFAPDELVTLTVVYEGRHEKRVRATSSGTFRVRFRFAIENCARFRVSARGNDGSRALYRSPIEVCGTPVAP